MSTTAPPHSSPPTAAPTPAPITCPSVPASGCSICGPGRCVSKPDAIFSFPQYPPYPCGVLQQGGYNGTITSEECQYLPGLVKDICACAGAPYVAPTAPRPAPTPVPRFFMPPTQPPNYNAQLLSLDINYNAAVGAMAGLGVVFVAVIPIILTICKRRAIRKALSSNMVMTDSTSSYPSNVVDVVDVVEEPPTDKPEREIT